jgi:excisionase family DNA binding protein
MGDVRVADPVTDRLLTTREVADRLGVMPETVLRWIESRGLPAIRLTSRALRYDEGELDAWLAERTTAAPGRGSVNHPDRRRQENANLPASTTLLRPAAKDEED